jgi:diguanylate cyclase (GGDEF)-like protein
LLKKPVKDLWSTHQGCRCGNRPYHFLRNASKSTENDIPRYQEFEALNKDGTVFPIEVGTTEVQQLGDINFIGNVRDVTQRKKREDEIRQLAFYDPLTLLPNRRLLIDRLQQVIANCIRQNHHAALLFLDLDNFKSLNDSLGHTKGDLLLCQVVARLIKSVRHGDTVSRLGGDEFVVLIEGLSSDRNEAAVEVEAAAEKIIAADRSSVHFFDPQMQVVASLRAAMRQDLYEALRKALRTSRPVHRNARKAQLSTGFLCERLTAI